MGRFVIVAYTPKDGLESQLLAVVKRHIQVLREHNLVSERSAYTMRAINGSIIEIFEWRSDEAIDQAHQNPTVQKLWSDFEAVCEFTPLAQLTESTDMFAEFEAIDL